MSLLPSLVSRVMLRNNVWGGGGGIRGGGGSLLPSSGCRQTADSHLGPPTSHNPPFSHLTLPANGQADCLPVLAEQATGPELEWGRWPCEGQSRGAGSSFLFEVGSAWGWRFHHLVLVLSFYWWSGLLVSVDNLKWTDTWLRFSRRNGCVSEAEKEQKTIVGDQKLL